MTGPLDVKTPVAPPALPTLGRYRSLFLDGPAYSITRTLQYEVLPTCDTGGRLLDLGGGEIASYRHLLQCDRYESVNIDPRAKPTWLVSIGDRLPCADQTYDVALSMNTFEHIFEPEFALRELFRALKPGGTFVTSVPFLLPIHGYPDDYFRPTSSWWIHTLAKIGFRDIAIVPLVWGPFSTGFVCSGAPGPGKRVRRHLNLLLDLLYVWLQERRDGRREAAVTALQKRPLGYFVTAVRP